MYTRLFTVSIFFILFQSNCNASFQITVDFLEAYSNYINLKPKVAENYLSKNADNGLSIYLENYGDIIRILASQNKDLYEKLEGKGAQRIKKLKALDKDSPYYLFTQAEVKFQWLIVKMNFREYWSAIWEAKQIYKLITKNHELYPDFIPNKKILGVFYTYLGSIPEDYEWVMKLLGMNGDAETGLKYLDQLSESDHYLKLEAEVGKIYLNAFLLKKKKQAFQDILKTLNKNPNNLFVKYVAIKICNLNNKGKEALEIINSITVDSSRVQIPLFDYLKGDLLLKTGNYKNAITSFDAFLNDYKGENNIKDAYFKTFLCKWFLEEKDAEKYLEKVKDEGVSENTKDKYAEKFADFDKLPNKKITQARFLYDGGSFEKALEILNKISQRSLPTKDKVELHYRKARVYHQQEKYEKAIKMYDKTIKISGNLPHYFAPNSALKAGNIYAEVFNNKEKAKTYYYKVFEYKKHEYEKGLDYAAKAALKKLE